MFLHNKMTKESFIKQLEINSSHVDPNIAQFSSAFLVHKKTIHLVEEVLYKRPDLTPLHFGLLAFASYRYALLSTKRDYSSELSSWPTVVDDINRNHFTLVLDAMRSNNVNITTKDRYAVILQVSKMITNGKPLKICDVGSGYYPMGIGKMLECEDELKPADANSADKLSDLHKKNVEFSRVVASDIMQPESDWAAACVWTDNKDLFELRTELKNDYPDQQNGVEFKVADVTNGFSRIVGKNCFDIVTMANVLYQLGEEGRMQAFSNINQALLEGGWFLSLEYMKGGSRRRPYTYAVVGYKKRGHGFEDPVTLAKLDSADCKSIMF